jgi:hypothetical protein
MLSGLSSTESETPKDKRWGQGIVYFAVG